MSLYLVLIVSKCLLSLVMSYPSASKPSDIPIAKSLFHNITITSCQAYSCSDHYNLALADLSIIQDSWCWPVLDGLSIM